MIKFACIAPHPPLLLPTVGSPADRQLVAQTSSTLTQMGQELAQLKVDEIIISSPHEDWGFNVPLYFLADDFKGKIARLLTGFESAQAHYEEGQKLADQLDQTKNYALIASGDLSHALKSDGPYQFHPDGPRFDQELVEALKNNQVKNIIKLDEKYPQAAECGLRSIALMLGVLKGAGCRIKPQVLSYEAPFGVGYLVAKLIKKA